MRVENQKQAALLPPGPRHLLLLLTEQNSLKMLLAGDQGISHDGKHLLCYLQELVLLPVPIWCSRQIW